MYYKMIILLGINSDVLDIPNVKYVELLLVIRSIQIVKFKIIRSVYLKYACQIVLAC